MALASAFPLATQHDTEVSVLLQELKCKRHLMADPVARSTHRSGVHRSWSASWYVESLQGKVDHILQCILTLLLCPHQILLCHRSALAWYDRTVPGPGKQKPWQENNVNEFTEL